MVDKTHAFHDYYVRNIRRLPEASVILINTFEALEHKFLDLMRTEVSKGTLQVSHLCDMMSSFFTHKSKLKYIYIYMYIYLHRLEITYFSNTELSCR